MKTKEQRIEQLVQGRGVFNFEGVLVTKLIGGWECFSIKSASPEGILSIIDNALEVVRKSIKETQY